MSYDEPRPAFFSEESYFDSAQAHWIDPEADKIPFGAEAVTVSYEGIDEEIAERAERDRNGSGRKPRPLPAELERPHEHTWREQDVVALGVAKPEPPEIGGVFYPGRRHDLSGEAEAGKSWLALAVAADEMRDRRGVVWNDADGMGPSAVLERLRGLGLDDETIRAHFAYLRPAEPISEEAIAYVQRLIVELSCRLVVFDAFNPSLALHGYDPNSSRDVEDFFRKVVDPFCQMGAAVVLPDHVVKQREMRGKYAYGSERKQTGVDVHIGLSAIEPFGRGRTGRAKLTVHKDRPGFLQRPSPGLFVLASDDDGRCSWHVEPDHSVSDPGCLPADGLHGKGQPLPRAARRAAVTKRDRDERHGQSRVRATGDRHARQRGLCAGVPWRESRASREARAGVS